MPKRRRQVILSRLQERLFELSRRNRLLHFRADAAERQPHLGLGADRPSTCGASARSSSSPGAGVPPSRRRRDPIPLSRYLRFEDARVYLPGVLDQIRAEARRDPPSTASRSCGWCSAASLDRPQGIAPERFDSPLVLLPVELTKRKGVRDVLPASAPAAARPRSTRSCGTSSTRTTGSTCPSPSTWRRRLDVFFDFPDEADPGERAGGRSREDRAAADRADPRPRPAPPGPVSPPRPVGAAPPGRS